MAQPPRFRAIRPEDLKGDVPEWAQQLLLALNETLGSIASALTGRLTRSENFLSGSKSGGTFRTKATLADTWPVEVKNLLPFQPTHVICSRLERVDGAAITDAWSYTWKMGANGLIQLSFQGLSVSTEYRFSLLYE